MKKLFVLVVLLISALRCNGFVPCQSRGIIKSSSSRVVVSPWLPHAAKRLPHCASSAGRELGLCMFGEVVPQTAYELVKDGYTYIDVRADSEFQNGHPAGAINIPAFFVTAMGMQKNPEFVNQVAEKYPEKDSKLVIGCQMGVRSAQAAAWLEDAGYQTVVNMEGGYGAWARDDSLPVEV